MACCDINNMSIYQMKNEQLYAPIVMPLAGRNVETIRARTLGVLGCLSFLGCTVNWSREQWGIGRSNLQQPTRGHDTHDTAPMSKTDRSLYWRPNADVIWVPLTDHHPEVVACTLTTYLDTVSYEMMDTVSHRCFQRCWYPKSKQKKRLLLLVPLILAH